MSEVARADAGDVAMALQWLQRMGLSPQDLIEPAAAAVRLLPDFAAFVPAVAGEDARPVAAVYGPYWARIVEQWGPRRLDEPGEADILAMIDHARRNAVVRRTSNGGTGAAVHTYLALRSVYRFAVADGLISARQNPIERITKPQKGKCRRHALAPELYQQIWQAATSPNDPALDALLLRFHLETAALADQLAVAALDMGYQQLIDAVACALLAQQHQPLALGASGLAVIASGAPQYSTDCSSRQRQRPEPTERRPQGR